MKRLSQFGMRAIMTPREAAGYLGLHIITIYRLVKAGGIPGFKIGGQWRFKKDLLDEWIKDKIKVNSQEAVLRKNHE